MTDKSMEILFDGKHMAFDLEKLKQWMLKVNSTMTHDIFTLGLKEELDALVEEVFVSDKK